MSCSIKKNVMPSSRLRRSMSAVSFFIRTRLTPAPGSSRRINLGSDMSVRASSSSFFCPPERFAAYSSLRCLNSRNPRTSVALIKFVSSCRPTRPGKEPGVPDSLARFAGGAPASSSRAPSCSSARAGSGTCAGPLCERCGEAAGRQCAPRRRRCVPMLASGNQ